MRSGCSWVKFYTLVHIQMTSSTTGKWTRYDMCIHLSDPFPAFRFMKRHGMPTHTPEHDSTVPSLTSSPWTLRRTSTKTMAAGWVSLATAVSQWKLSCCARFYGLAKWRHLAYASHVCQSYSSGLSWRNDWEQWITGNNVDVLVRSYQLILRYIKVVSRAAVKWCLYHVSSDLKDKESKLRNTPERLQCCQQSIVWHRFSRITQRNDFVIHCQHRLSDSILLAWIILHNDLVSIVKLPWNSHDAYLAWPRLCTHHGLALPTKLVLRMVSTWTTGERVWAQRTWFA